MKNNLKASLFLSLLFITIVAINFSEMPENQLANVATLHLRKRLVARVVPDPDDKKTPSSQNS
jgi:hypothetical protein